MIVQCFGIDIYNNCLTGKFAKTLNSVATDSDHLPCVVYDARGNGDGKISPTITGDHNHRISDYTAVVCETLGFNHLNGSKAASNAETLNGSPTLRNNSPTSAVIAYCYSQDAYDKYTESKPIYVVRRLTPLECCRLQGMPDFWTDGVEGSDAARYKLWGNGMALPNALYIMEGF